ncbi:hypothetical protein GEMRC1_002314 [Eukaryota sp. GEM-RC1]
MNYPIRRKGSVVVVVLCNFILGFYLPPYIYRGSSPYKGSPLPSMYSYSAQRPTVITVGNPHSTNSLSAPLLNGTSRIESCKFLEDLQAYVAALQASEALSRPAVA